MLVCLTPSLLPAQIVYNNVAEKPSSTPPPPAGAVSSAGLINDWLRKKWPEQAAAWDFGGQVRAQYDSKYRAGSYPDGNPNLDFIRDGVDNENAFLLMREKIHLGYNQKWFNIFLEARDSSTSGDDRDPNPFADSLDLHQAYIQIGSPKQFPLVLKVGRQQMQYGDERFISVSDFNNLERTFDAVKLRYITDNFWVDGFVSHYVLPNNGEINLDNWNDCFSGIYASTRTIVPKQETQLYFLSHNVNGNSPSIVNTSGTGTTPRDVYTLGARIRSLPGGFGGWDYGTEFAGQLGSDNRTGRRLQQQSEMIDIVGGYTWENAAWKPRVGVDFTYGSGDHNPKDNTHQTFDLLFGSTHKFYGIMDVTGLRNTLSPSVNLVFHPLQKLSVKMDYFWFWLADTHDLSYSENGPGRTLHGYGIHPEYNSYFGSEVDIVANYTVTSFLSFQAGYSHFFVGDYVRQSLAPIPANGGAVGADYYYLMATLNF